jgi:ligand-binding sensor domain-containing protein
VRYLLLTLQLVLLSFNGQATLSPIDIRFTTSNQLFITLDQRQGLGQPGILSMAKDDLGYIWVGTQAGLNRYDGYKFKQFSKKDAEFSLLAGNYISSLCNAPNQQLWIGTRSGISRYNYRTGVISTFTKENNNLPSNKISSLSCQNNHVIVGTFNRGFFSLDATTGLVLPDSISPQLRVQEVNQTATDNFAATTIGLFKQTKNNIFQKLTNINATSIATVKEWLFVSHSDGTIKRYDINSDFKQAQWTKTNIKGQYRAINKLEIQQGFLWVASKKGLHKLDFDGNLIKHYKHNKLESKGLIDNNILSLLAIDKKHLWIGSANNGISHLNLKSNQFCHINDMTFSGNTSFNHDIRSFGFDPKNRLWIGTSEGVYISNGQHIKRAVDYYPELKNLDLSFVSKNSLNISKHGRSKPILSTPIILMP